MSKFLENVKTKVMVYGERFYTEFDFSKRFTDEPETIDEIQSDVTAIYMPTGDDVTNDLIGNIIFNGSIIKAEIISNGTGIKVNGLYQVTFKAVTDKGTTYIERIFVNILK